MKHSLLLCVSFLAAVPLLAQEGPPNRPPPLKQQAFQHLHVINGRDNPAAIPIYETTLIMLNGRYSRDLAGSFDAVNRFSNDYGVDSVRAEAMIAAIRKTQSDLETARAAQIKAFCARSFANKDQWLAAVIAFDAESVSARVSAFNRLRDVAGPEVWEKILLKAHAAAPAVSMVQEDHADVAADIGYETAFSNQCRNAG